jgi:RNA polymerase sigma-70 factor (ECF subfamily)
MELTLDWGATWSRYTPGRFCVSLDDSNLVERARAGDDAAFAVLFEQFHAPILNYLHRMDTFIKAYKALPKTKPDLAFKAWLYRIATNTALSHLRRGKIVQFLPFIGDREHNDERVDHAVTRQTDIENVLNQLPKHYAAVLLLRHYQGLSLAETAEALDITENAAKLRLFRARKAFAKIYGVAPDGSVDEEVLS